MSVLCGVVGVANDGVVAVVVFAVVVLVVVA